MAVQQSLQNIAYQHNNLARDFQQLADRLLGVEKAMSLQGSMIDQNSRDLSDLQQLVQFLEKNPGADLKDWVRYEAVKERLLKAAGEQE